MEIRKQIKQIESDVFLPLLKNTLNKYTFTYTCLITISLYILIFLGENVIKLPSGFLENSILFFLHEGECFFIII